MADQDGAAPPSPRPIFEDVVFYIIVGPDLPEDVARKHAKTLEDNGAREAHKFPASKNPASVPCDITELTHILSVDVDFAWYCHAEQYLVPVVTPEWITMSVDKNKIAHIRPFSPDPRMIFTGVNVTCADLPPGDKEAICGGILAMGGQYSSTLNRFVSHVVALDMESDKCQKAKDRKDIDIKIVMPHWFDDCLKLGKRISEDPYTLPNPAIERERPSDPIDFPTNDLSLSYPRPDGTAPPKARSPVFKGKRVMLCSDLSLGKRLAASIEQVIRQAEGTVVHVVADADVLVCHFREGEDYIQASRRGISVGSLTWMYWMLTHGRWTSPLNRPLHYPSCRTGLPGMEEFSITVSNYGGDARLYLEHLIEAVGAKFTKSMRADNTHLLTARIAGEKCRAAREWNVHMVSHLWLEESYAKWEVQSLTNPRYTHFPPRTNLMEVVGQTPLEAKALEQFYEEEEQSPPPAVDHRGKKRATPLQDHRHQNTVSGPLTRTETPIGTSTLGTRESSMSSTGRKAKERAMARLHDEIAPDMLLYQKEQKRKGGVMGGRRRRSSGSLEAPRLAGRKRTQSATPDNENKPTKGKKRVKPTISLLITGHKKWIGNHAKQEKEEKVLASLGIECVDNPSDCTHLAAPGLLRTEKFCCALPKAPTVVSIAWVEACVREKRLIDPSEDSTYILKDPEGEKRLHVNLASSLSNAKANDGRLLDGQAIFCTNRVHGGFDTCSRIAKANGGAIMNWSKLPKGVKPANCPDSDDFVLLTVKEDKSVWAGFEKLCAKEERECRIYRADWLLDAAMTQMLRWDEAYDVPV